MSVIGDFQVNGAAPSTIGTLGTSKVYFPRLLGSSIGVESIAPSATSAIGQLNVPGLNVLNGLNFDVLIGGSVVGGTGAPSTNVTITLEAQTSSSLSSPSYTILATSGAVALNPVNDGVAENFLMKVALFGTTASGIVTGTRSSTVGTTRVEATSLSNNLSGINFGNGVPFGLVIGVTFSVASTGSANVAVLNQFQISAA